MSDQYNIEVKYKGAKDSTINLSKILEIHEAELTVHFAKQASIFGYFSIQLAEAERLLGIAKSEAEQDAAVADAYYREGYRVNDEKYTEAVIRGDVLLDEHYQKALDEQRQAKYNMDVLKSVVNALKMKADMLISMGAHLRQEYDMTGMAIREQSMGKELDKVKKVLKKSG